MASAVHRLLPVSTMSNGFSMPDEYALDLGAYNTLQFMVNVVVKDVGGTTPEVVFMHAAYNEPGAWVDLDGAKLNVQTAFTGPTLVTVSDFARFIKMRFDGTAGSTAAIVAIDVVAKE